MNFRNIKSGDRLILTGSRKQPVKVLSNKSDVIKYKTSRGIKGHVIRNKFANIAYDINNCSSKIVKKIKKVVK